MERPLKEHIADLERQIENLKERQGDLDLTAAERYKAAINLEIAERALSYFRQAYGLEKQVQRNLV
jgi:hypothetical protein